MANVGTGWKLDLPRPIKSSVRECKVAIWATDPLCPTSVEITVRKSFCRVPVYTENESLPRQARDKHVESWKRTRFCMQDACDAVAAALTAAGATVDTTARPDIDMAENLVRDARPVLEPCVY